MMEETTTPDGVMPEATPEEVSATPNETEEETEAEAPAAV